MKGLNHPILTQPDYSTIMMGWWDGGLQFFEPIPPSGGTILIDTYYFSYFLTFLSGFFLMRALQKSGFLRLERRQIVDLALFSIIGIMLGARVGYILFYNLEFYIQNPSQILAWSGMASHGALGGLVVSTLLFAKKFKASFFNVADSICLCVPFGALFIRFANFLNAELYGRSAELPWSMRFPMYDGQGRALFLNTNNEARAMEYAPGGDVYLVPTEKLPAHAFESFEFVKSEIPQQVFNAKLGSIDGVNETVARMITDLSHPSQIYQLVLGFLVLGLYLWWLKSKAKFQGFIFAQFLIAYGALRIFMEFFRQPDVQRSEGLFQYVSMGQLLSLALIAFGFILFGYLKERSVSKNP